MDFKHRQWIALIALALGLWAVGGCSSTGSAKDRGWDRLTVGMSYSQAERTLAGTPDDMTRAIEGARAEDRAAQQEQYEIRARIKLAGTGYVPPKKTTFEALDGNRRLVFDRGRLVAWSRGQ